ncbi:uncharacterized protein BO66DRAFT_394019 [Aspergillus aculeatinus CBS 121060]|uniref:Uncharacterized protein n=1 Tax=Aspergillus aculeatinus CBS 121060 TaxID=1448322 RepID=A0ACD1H1C1_9EURO|nr:hypothetical protein BO66DRAFT_394019 [Aspergillus aculeatinus CBS 121060]RAH67221.1 hypothetical protein BO66DRAFT_394019 [Aspergillus aculeatinus CBS 121060]
MESSRPASPPNPQPGESAPPPDLENMPVELFWQMAQHLPVETLTSLRTVSRKVSAKARQPFAQCGLRTLSMTLDVRGYDKVDEIANHEFYHRFPQRLAVYPPEAPCDSFWTDAALRKLGQTLEHQLARCREMVLYYGAPDQVDRMDDMLSLHALCRMLAVSQIPLRYLVLFRRQAPERRAIQLLDWPQPYLPPNISGIWTELRQLHVYEPEDNGAIEYLRVLLPAILQNASQLEEFKHVVSPRVFFRSYVIPLRCAIWADEDPSLRAPAPLRRVEVAGSYINLEDLMGWLGRYGPTLERVQICVTYAHGSATLWSEVLKHMKEVCPVLRYVSVVTCRRSLGCVESEDRGQILEALDRMIETAEHAGI